MRASRRPSGAGKDRPWNRAFESLSQRVDNPDLLWLALLLAFSGVAGVAAGIKPVLGVGFAVGIALIALVMWSLIVGVVLFTLMSFLEVTSSASSTLSVMKIAGVLLFCSWLVGTIRLQRREGISLRRVHRRIAVPALAFLGWAALSFAWSQSPSASGAATWRYVQDFLLLPIVISAVRRREHIVWLVAAFVVGGLAAAIYGFISPQSVGSRDFGRLSATNLDANGVALALAVAVAFAAALLRVLRGRRLLHRCLAVAMAFALVGILDTQSRSGLIALLTLLLTMALVGGRWRRRATLLLILLATATVGYLAAAPANSDQHLTSADTAGRSTLWLVGWRMFESHPLTGVGVGNFSVSSVHYVSEPGTITRADLIVDTPLPTHNVYLQLLAELGIPGLVAFLAIVLVAATSALRAAVRFRDTSQTGLELIARCYVGALAAFMASNFFQSDQFAKQLWLLIALGPALLAVAMRDSNESVALRYGQRKAPRPTRPMRPLFP